MTMVAEPLVVVKVVIRVLRLRAGGVFGVSPAPPCELPAGATVDCPGDRPRGAAGLPLV